VGNGGAVGSGLDDGGETKPPPDTPSESIIDPLCMQLTGAVVEQEMDEV
jgi:hypothetical protein